MQKGRKKILKILTEVQNEKRVNAEKRLKLLSCFNTSKNTDYFHVNRFIDFNYLVCFIVSNTPNVILSVLANQTIMLIILPDFFSKLSLVWPSILILFSNTEIKRRLSKLNPRNIQETKL